jgi:hypothetical protein
MSVKGARPAAPRGLGFLYGSSTRTATSCRHEFWCETEDEAKQRAQQLLDGRDAELWHRDRGIATFWHNELRGTRHQGDDTQSK